MKKKYIFLFSTVFLGLTFYGEQAVVPASAQQAILNPQNPREKIVPVAPSVSEETSGKSSSSVTEASSSAATTATSQEETPPTKKQRDSTEKHSPKSKRKKVFVTDELFTQKELPVALNPHSGGDNDADELNFYTRLCYNLSGSALYGRKAGT